LQGISGSFDETGRRNLTRDIVSTRVGHDLADRYAPQQVEPRPTIDTKIAFLENQELMSGEPVPVVDAEMHTAHLTVHLPELNKLIEELNQGVADPVPSLPALQAFYQHISETVQAIAADPSAQALVANAKQILQYAEEMINNTSKQVQKMQREQTQDMRQPDKDQQELARRQEEHNVKLQMARQKAELDMELKQAKFRQEQAIEDAKTVAKLRENQ